MTTIPRMFFWMYDEATTFLRRWYQEVKMAILLIAHASLFGFFFPDLRNSFGEWSRNLLVFIVFLSPITKLFPISLFQLLMGMRRQLGIFFAYLVTVHGIGYLIDPVWFPLPLLTYFATPLRIEPVLLAGIVSYMLTLPLLFTSNALSIRILKRKWVTLHRIVYGVFFFGMIHSFTIRHASGIWNAVFVISVYLALKILARYPNIVPISSIKKFVGEEYGRYVNR
ncbi:MAG: ferric reductase-like transmembrane domain-containing protein [Candidatus Moraniibacteriota bacterium]|nr:MAG: ferric reductase-like transmembrane domain-containing protein [Candidatus Moranbacteria bacterium]